MKNILIRFCSLLIILILSGCVKKVPVASKNDITTFRVNNSHTGIYSGSGIKNPEGFKWIFKTGGPVRSTPAVLNSTVYFGSSDGNLYAVDLLNGAEKWKFKSGGAVQSSPSISGNKIFFTSRNGYLYALDLNAGKEIWRNDLGKDIPYSWGFDYYLSSPVIEDNNLFVGSGSGKFCSVNANNGEVIWTYDCNSRIRSTALLTGSLVLFGDMDGTFYAIAKDKGNLVWKFDVDGKKINNKEFGFDRKAILSSAAASEDKVIFGSRDGNLYALNIKDGKLDWKFSHGTSWVITSPSVLNGIVYAGSSDAYFVQAVSLNSGKELWRYNTKNAVWSSPAVNQNEIYFADFSGALYSLDLKSGREKWTEKLMNCFITSSPVISGGNVLIGGDDGNLYCLKGNNQANQDGEVKHAVFWEDSKEYKWFQNGVDEITKDFFKSAGYKVLDRNSLADFFNEQLKTNSHGVVIFASNKIPASVYDESKNNYLIKDYLKNGGKVVFLGPNPLAFIFDNKTGKLAGIDFRIPFKFIGIDYNGELTDAMKGWFYSKVTSEGEKWGLTGWWVGIAAVDKYQVSEVLAEDENGNAAAWVKNFGGAEGTGLVQLWINRSVPQDLSKIKLAAEYGL